jgi:hypothetical protein
MVAPQGRSSAGLIRHGADRERQFDLPRNLTSGSRDLGAGDILAPLFWSCHVFIVRITYTYG